ncbi:MAG: 3'(2'),5'-bisphosphate nucleotidase CysQ [Acidimicrobiia bacterium]|jgi:3'(2'), 5'-bisphosphate nucleotidase|nr:3'(2'),5'-bisphosphate nucleotidase CysQ [Acidimicrobiia bacterium]MBP8180364.1 3'(2'),5'-bisphosphate nucleotidase CysQ [Acidimicrobiia bacterium]
MATPDDHQLAADLAEDAGKHLLDIRKQAGKLDTATLKDEGDRGSNALILQRLKQERPDDAVLSEEAADSDKRLTADRVWIVDPLDGTREFGEEGRTDWAVHVALWEKGDLVAGAVALPAQDKVFSTAKAIGLAPAHKGGPRLAVSRSRPPALAEQLADALGGSLVPMGSAGAKAMSVVQGDSDIYAHGGGQYEWDSAAPVAVARHAGLHTSRLDGSTLVYNEKSPWLPDLLICRPEYAEQIREIIHRLTRDNPL